MDDVISISQNILLLIFSLLFRASQPQGLDHLTLLRHLQLLEVTKNLLEYLQIYTRYNNSHNTNNNIYIYIYNNHHHNNINHHNIRYEV